MCMRIAMCTRGLDKAIEELKYGVHDIYAHGAWLTPNATEDTCSKILLHTTLIVQDTRYM